MVEGRAAARRDACPTGALRPPTRLGRGTRHATSIALEPLSDAAMRALLAGFVPGLPEAAVAIILARADGMPLYAVETVRALVADGRLERVGDGYRPVGDLGELTIPETLRSLIASRLDALEPVDRALLQDASVLGQVFTLAAWRRWPALTADLASDEFEPRLRGLVRRELLELEADPRSPERGQYRFVQSLIREVAYGTLARRERGRHLAAARYFESLGEDELAGALAGHYLAAHEASAPAPRPTRSPPRPASPCAVPRTEPALGAHDQAVTYLQQALAVTADPAERGSCWTRWPGPHPRRGRTSVGGLRARGDRGPSRSADATVTARPRRASARSCSTAAAWAGPRGARARARPDAGERPG